MWEHYKQCWVFKLTTAPVIYIYIKTSTEMFANVCCVTPVMIVKQVKMI